jgi:hypothetical protein
MIHEEGAHWFLKTLASTRVEEEPFPHFQKSPTFGKAYYSELFRHWPKADFFIRPSDGRADSRAGNARAPAGVYARHSVLPLNKIELARLATEDRTFWEKASAWLTGEAVIKGFLAKFRPYFRLARFAEADWYKLAPEILLVEDQDNYALPPCTDAPTTLFTFVVYVTDDVLRPDLGTWFYAADDAGGNLRPARRFKYLPDNAVAFLRTDVSFYGTERVRATGSTRRLMIYTCHIGEPGQNPN